MYNKKDLHKIGKIVQNRLASPEMVVIPRPFLEGQKALTRRARIYTVYGDGDTRSFLTWLWQKADICFQHHSSPWNKQAWPTSGPMVNSYQMHEPFKASRSWLLELTAWAQLTSDASLLAIPKNWIASDGIALGEEGECVQLWRKSWLVKLSERKYNNTHFMHSLSWITTSVHWLSFARTILPCNISILPTAALLLTTERWKY